MSGFPLIHHLTATIPFALFCEMFRFIRHLSGGLPSYSPGEMGGLPAVFLVRLLTGGLEGLTRFTEGIEIFKSPFQTRRLYRTAKVRLNSGFIFDEGPLLILLKSDS